MKLVFGLLFVLFLGWRILIYESEDTFMKIWDKKTLKRFIEVVVLDLLLFFDVLLCSTLYFVENFN
jgi:hypothetical protein